MKWYVFSPAQSNNIKNKIITIELFLFLIPTKTVDEMSTDQIRVNNFCLLGFYNLLTFYIHLAN